MKHKLTNDHGGITSALLKLMMIIIVILLLIAGGMYLFGDQIKEKAASVITEKAIEQISEHSGIPSDQIQSAVDSLAEDDRETVTDIIDNHLTPETATDINSYIQDGDVSGLITYAQENLSPEEFQKLSEIYEKYAG